MNIIPIIFYDIVKLIRN